MTPEIRLPEDIEEGRFPPRVVIENVQPEIDGGRFPIKRTVGEQVAVKADIHADGHDVLAAVVRYRLVSGNQDVTWQEEPLKMLGNDRWGGAFTVRNLGRYEYTLEAWVEHFASWRRDLAKKYEAGQDVSSDLLEGAQLIERAVAAAFRSPRRDAGSSGDLKVAATADTDWLRAQARLLRAPTEPAGRVAVALDPELQSVMRRQPDRSEAACYRHLSVVVDWERARFSSWYEMFARSSAPQPGRRGTLRDCEARLPYVASMGFDVLYLPPIHPVGHTSRKGKNSAPQAGPGDPGSPWAIGSEEGGHTAIDPKLGTLEDFHSLQSRARDYGIEIAFDLAFQCTPDHPWVKEHPEWFRRRPDGSIKYAENPPKKYEDIYPLNFETAHWRELWEELKRVTLFWIAQGVRIFRVDNPHTKPFAFWEWLIAGVKRDYPEVIFLAEAFTRPKIMYRLAKIGFTQSYTYFAWRNTKEEITQYFEELTRTGVLEYFRPNLWPTTPDILTEYLQYGGRPAFLVRLVLAATLGANYGIYGPAFELCESRAVAPGKEEYLYSEKYEIRYWDIERQDSLKDFIGRVNRIRRQNAALQNDYSLRFHPVDNEQLIAYSKQAADLSGMVVVVVNLDPHHTQSGWVELPIHAMELSAEQSYQMHDLLSDARYFWRGARNFVQLDPQVAPARVFVVQRHIRTERDFDYFM